MAAQQVEAALFLVLLVAAANVLASQVADTTATTPTQPATSERSTEEPEAVDPFLEDLCIIENSTEAYRVNTEWTEEACDQKCRCVFRSTPLDDGREVLLLKTINMNSSSELTEIRCSMPPKCGSIESRIHQASRCARPLLAFSNGEPCSCPKLYCADMPFMSMRPSTPSLVGSTTNEAPTNRLAAITAPYSTTPVSTTQRLATVVATVGPSILQPIKSFTTTTTQKPTTTSTARASSPEPASIGSQATMTEASLTTVPTNTVSFSTSTSTSTLRQATVAPSILQPVKNTTTSPRPTTTMHLPTSPEPPVTEGYTASGPTSTVSPASTTTTTTSDSSTQSTSDNPIMPAISVPPNQKADLGCAKKSLDDFEASYESCQVNCRCENNKLKCGNLLDAAIAPSQSIDLEPLPWTQQIQSRMNVQKYAWHLLVGFVTMSVMFIIVLFMYMKKSTFVMTSLAAQTGYDNASYNSRLTEESGSGPGISTASSKSSVGGNSPPKWETAPNLSSLPSGNVSHQVYW